MEHARIIWDFLHVLTRCTLRDIKVRIKKGGDDCTNCGKAFNKTKLKFPNWATVQCHPSAFWKEIRSLDVVIVIATLCMPTFWNPCTQGSNIGWYLILLTIIMMIRKLKCPPSVFCKETRQYSELLSLIAYICYIILFLANRLVTWDNYYAFWSPP